LTEFSPLVACCYRVESCYTTAKLYIPSIHWRAIFFVFAGISTLSALGALLVIDADIRDPSADRRVDWIGAMLVTTGLVLFTFVLGEGESAPQQWRTPCAHYIIFIII
jgi:hypothetical protein